MTNIIRRNIYIHTNRQTDRQTDKIDLEFIREHTINWNPLESVGQIRCKPFENSSWYSRSFVREQHDERPTLETLGITIHIIGKPTFNISLTTIHRHNNHNYIYIYLLKIFKTRRTSHHKVVFRVVLDITINYLW